MLAGLYFRNRQGKSNPHDEEHQPSVATSHLTELSRDTVVTTPTAMTSHGQHSRQFVTSAEVLRQKEHILSAGDSPPLERHGNRVVAPQPAPSEQTATLPLDDVPLPAPPSVFEPLSAGGAALQKDEPDYMSARVLPFNGAQSYNTANSVVQRLKEIAGPRSVQAADDEFTAISAARRSAFFRTLFNEQSAVASPLLCVHDSPPCGDIQTVYNGGYAQTIESLSALRVLLQ